VVYQPFTCQVKTRFQSFPFKLNFAALQPGKTKHFQTLELGDGLLLADCPGLVFPSFTSSRAELVCNGGAVQVELCSCGP
jgi:ribosome biogenesis GTPase A